MVTRIAIGFGTPIGISQDAALGKDRRRIPGQQDNPGRSGVVFARDRIVPHQAT